MTVIQAYCCPTFLAAVFCCFLFTGCCSVETWTWCGQSKMYIEDAEGIFSNGVARAIKIKCSEFAATSFKSNDIQEDDIDVTQSHLCEIRSFSFYQDPQKKLKQIAGHIIPVSRQEFDDNDFMANVLLNYEDYNFVILISDLARWRKYFAIPIQHEHSEENGISWTLLIMDNPWIDYDKNYYLKKDVGWSVYMRRLVFVPFAALCDVMTFPVQIILGSFCHM